MSCFSGNVQAANTRIFARSSGKGTQFLAYQMDYATDNDVAMIMPLPTPPNPALNTVRFIDLSGYPDLFADMDKGFPYTRGPSYGNESKTHARAHQQVGSFDASFVPTLDGLEQLDPQYRIPRELWDQLPEYNDFSFAVFKLRADAHSIHPIALEFSVRNPNLLFFPTVQINNGAIPAEANFDHDLFCQARPGWLRSYDTAGSIVDVARAQDVVDAGERISRMTVQGLHPNSDILVGLRA